MALEIQVRFSKAGYDGLPLYDATSDAQETLTSSSSAVNGTKTASDGAMICRLKAVGSGESYAAIGVGIVATSSNGFLMGAGDVVDVGRVPKGSRLSVIDK